MLELSRTVRFCLNAPGGDTAAPRTNTFSAWPATRGLGRYYELVVRCRGEADPATGYFINIKHIDTAVRDHAIPLFQDAAQRESTTGPAAVPALLQHTLASLQPALGHTVAGVELRLTPFVALALETSAMHHVLIKQRYEFSAAHRLHVPGYSGAQNRETFGKCNNPAGHGHNYQLEVVVRTPIRDDGRSLDVAELDTLVDQHVITPLDHKHLNVDVPAFANRNPSVEHIVETIWEMLDGQLPDGGTLHELTVWETGKTACTYHGPAETADA